MLQFIYYIYNSNTRHNRCLLFVFIRGEHDIHEVSTLLKFGYVLIYWTKGGKEDLLALSNYADKLFWWLCSNIAFICIIHSIQTSTYCWFTVRLHSFTYLSANIVSLGWCGQIIVLNKSACGIKTTYILWRINILIKRMTCSHSKFMRTLLCSHYVPYCYHLY